MRGIWLLDTTLQFVNLVGKNVPPILRVILFLKEVFSTPHSQKCQSKNKETKNQCASVCERNLLADTSKIVENKICKCKEEDCRKVVPIRAQ